MPEPRLVLVEVTPEGLSVPDLVDLDYDDMEEAEWYCPQGTLEIRFAPSTTENPFPGDGAYLAAAGGACVSGLPVNARPNRSYKYSIVVTTLEDPPRVLTLDPRVRMVRRARPHTA
ncbi:MAG: hypothetical protein ACKV2V_02630 [Blastocatellia bacterium]